MNVPAGVVVGTRSWQQARAPWLPQGKAAARSRKEEPTVDTRSNLDGPPGRGVRGGGVGGHRPRLLMRPAQRTGPFPSVIKGPSARPEHSTGGRGAGGEGRRLCLGPRGAPREGTSGQDARGVTWIYPRAGPRARTRTHHAPSGPRVPPCHLLVCPRAVVQHAGPGGTARSALAAPGHCPEFPRSQTQVQTKAHRQGDSAESPVPRPPPRPGDPRPGLQPLPRPGLGGGAGAEPEGPAGCDWAAGRPSGPQGPGFLRRPGGGPVRNRAS